MRHKWRSLSDIQAALSRRRPFTSLTYPDLGSAIENACRSTEVPVRGRLGRWRYSSLLPEGAFDRIEKHIGSASISVTDNTAFYQIPGKGTFPTKITYCCVEADQRAVERWIIENVLAPDVRPRICTHLVKTAGVCLRLNNA